MKQPSLSKLKSEQQQQMVRVDNSHVQYQQNTQLVRPSGQPPNQQSPKKNIYLLNYQGNVSII